MTKKDYIRAADLIRRETRAGTQACNLAIALFSMFFAEEPGAHFDSAIFQGYINGTCGPAGGRVREHGHAR